MPGGSDLNQRARDQVSDQGFWRFVRLDLLRDVFDSNDLNLEGSVAGGTLVTGVTKSLGTFGQGLETIGLTHGNTPSIGLRIVLPDELSTQVQVVDRTLLKNARASAIQLGMVIKQTSAGAADTVTMTLAANYSRHVKPTGTTPADYSAGTGTTNLPPTNVKTGNIATTTALVIPTAFGVATLLNAASSNKVSEIVWDISGCLTSAQEFPRPRDILLPKFTIGGNTNDDCVITDMFVRYRVNLAPDDYTARDKNF